ncbi:unnamed protein product [Timema podura]|uniref:Uncharacterized protein n=1 Tax=Timema podura TaxID=61482 RepID=A0ABN7P355_TIMPD|nr:unnamed protein product [Timema podura]
MLKFLTHKLRTHTLNEDHPHQDKAEDTDRDSGTESDDEHGETEDPESSFEFSARNKNKFRQVSTTAHHSRIWNSRRQKNFIGGI